MSDKLSRGALHARLCELIRKANTAYTPQVNGARLDACEQILGEIATTMQEQKDALSAPAQWPNGDVCCVVMDCLVELAYGNPDRKDGVRAACMLLRQSATKLARLCKRDTITP